MARAKGIYRRGDSPYWWIDVVLPDGTRCGRICFGSRKINLSTVFAGQNVGVKEVSDKIWLVSFMNYDARFFDHEAGRLANVENPFAAKVLPMSPV